MGQCTNLTELTHEGSEEMYFLLEGEPFDKFLLSKILQILLYSLEIYFRMVLDFRIFREIISKDQLQTPANAAIFVFLASDLVLISHHAIFAFVVLIKERIWIHKYVGEIDAFLNAFFGIFNFLCLTIMTLEKVMYTKFPFKHLRFFSVKKTILYMLLCGVPTFLYCLGIHIEFHVHYISNTLSMFYCFHEGNIAVRHIFWVIPVLFIIIIVCCHASILVNLCYNRCHIPQQPGFTMDRMDGDFVGRFIRATISNVILTTSVFIDLMLRVLFQYINTPVHINRALWVLSVLLRMLNPLIILGGNGPLRNYVYNTGFQRSPSWLPSKMQFYIERTDKDRQFIARIKGQHKVSDISINVNKPVSNNKSYFYNMFNKNIKCTSKETSV